ncbi:hypothetical protein LEP1GSC035_4564 [Leptospira noguchii str. 2007001578]|uniref:Lipoprotein n=1 Tax=Leptospira noguchii str. 2007001578 TaxID=1049974 RepID=A0ABP2TDC4_9LEPT|nr:hypothetical protein LEP1GSC035_4564 [Leptospira noguchii str. 2007001578]
MDRSIIIAFAFVTPCSRYLGTPPNFVLNFRKQMIFSIKNFP